MAFRIRERRTQSLRDRAAHYRHPLERAAFFRAARKGKCRTDETKVLRCAIYTRKSTDHGLELEFNSLDAQREACEAFIKSQIAEGWQPLPQRYDDAAYSGGDMDRPALQKTVD